LTFHRSVLEASSLAGGSSSRNDGSGRVETAFEMRVKSYKIDTKSAIEARVRAEKEKAREDKDRAEREAKEKLEIEAEEKRLEDIFAEQPAIDDGVDVYEDVGSAEDNLSADEEKQGSKRLVDADYDDYDGDEAGKDGKDGDLNSGGGATSPHDDYEEDSGTTSTTLASSTSKVGDFEDLEDGEAFLKAMEGCNDLICLQEAHAKYTRTEDMFNFPHFMIIGFQKAATTSLKKYLEEHSQIDKPRVKEPNFFSRDCHEKPPEQCSEKNTTNYINSILHKPKYIEQRGRIACMEASTHIVRAGHNLAPRMAKLMPWLKIIVQFREPISRAASMLIHNKDVNNVGCLTRSPMAHCLLHHSQLTEMEKNKYEPLTYTEAIQPWIENFPKDQIHIVQYETLIDPEQEESEHLRVKRFLGVDERRPEGGLPRFNARRFSISPEGWKMRKGDYEELVSLVEPDMEGLLDLLYEHGLLTDREEWAKQWRNHWKSNLATCGNDNSCLMSLS